MTQPPTRVGRGLRGLPVDQTTGVFGRDTPLTWRPSKVTVPVLSIVHFAWRFNSVGVISEIGLSGRQSVKDRCMTAFRSFDPSTEPVAPVRSQPVICLPLDDLIWVAFNAPVPLDVESTCS